MPRPCTACLESPPRGTTRTGSSTGWRNQRRVLTGEDIFSHRLNRDSDLSAVWEGGQDYQGFRRQWLLVTGFNRGRSSLVILSEARNPCVAVRNQGLQRSFAGTQDDKALVLPGVLCG